MLEWVRARVLGIAPVVLASAVAVSGTSCIKHDGAPPFPAELHYPTAIAVVDLPSGPYLVVVNSDFDLRFNAAAVQSYDLDKLNEAIDASCAIKTSPSERASCAVVPDQAQSATDHVSTISVTEVPGLFLSEVLISAYANGIAVMPSNHRMYIPVRGDGNVTRVELDDSGLLSCGGSGNGQTCTSAFTTTIRTAEQVRDITVPTDPIGLAAGSLADLGLPASYGDYVIVAQRTGATTFYYVPSTPIAGEAPGQPVLTDVLSGLPPNLVTITHQPGTSSFLSPSGTSSFIANTTVAVDQVTTEADLASTRLRVGQPVVPKGLDTGSATTPNFRQVEFDPRPPPDEHAGWIYGVSRTPESLVTFTPNAAGGYATSGIVQLGSEPTRLSLAFVAGRLLAFVSCYQSRTIDIIDVDAQRKVATIAGLSGPYEFVVDPAHTKPTGESAPRVYVADFKSSVIRVVNLSPLAVCLSDPNPTSFETCSPTVLGMMGVPYAVEALR